MKILIIRFSSIGDIVLTSPVVRCLKTQLKNIEIHFLTKSNYISILRPNPYIDRVYTIKKSTKKILPVLKSEKYNLIIDLHNNIRTLLIKKSLQVKSYSFNKENIKKWLYVNFKINKMPHMHIVDRYMATVQSLGVKNDMKGLDFFIPKSEFFELSDYNLIANDYLVYAIGGQLNTKKMPKEKIIDLINKIDDKIVLIGGKEDLQTAKFVQAHSKSKKLINLVGKFNLHQSAWLTKNAKLLITHDTGMMHITASFNKKIIAIWGNTVPSFGMYAYEPNFFKNVINIENNISCRPCSKIGFQNCPKKHFKCMDHNVNDILKEINHLLIDSRMN